MTGQDYSLNCREGVFPETSTLVAVSLLCAYLCTPTTYCVAYYTYGSAKQCSAPVLTHSYSLGWI